MEMPRLRELRLLNGYTQQFLADFLDIKRPTYTRYESGSNEPDISTLLKLCDLYGVSMDYLLGKTQKDKPVPPEEDELARLLEDPETREFYELIKDFSDDELEDLLNYGQYLIAKRDSKKKP